jgi:hypothetical protein
MAKFYVTTGGIYLGGFDGEGVVIPDGAVEILTPPEDGRSIYNFTTGSFPPYMEPVNIPQVLADTLKNSAIELTASGVILTPEEASLITTVSVSLRDLALWAPPDTFKAQAIILLQGLPVLRPVLEPFRELMLSKLA